MKQEITSTLCNPPQGGREPPDAMSLHYADTSLPDFLDRPSRRNAEMSMRNTSNSACVIQEVF